MLVGLEMGKGCMSPPLFDALPVWPIPFGLATHLAAGTALGVLHFSGLWWTIRAFADGRVVTSIALTIGRFALLGGLLTLGSFEGAAPLLMMALGLLIARFMVVRRARKAAT
jgi:F1F0 ATPase subunit 2